MRYKLLAFLAMLHSGICYTPPESLNLLVEGNKRYVDNKLLHPNRSLERREEIASAQEPFAIIVGCSDSRVSPEILFDQGLGDLFVVRVAGNVVGPVELDSIEYAAKYLGSSIVLVLGHKACGAVTAVMQGKTADIEDVADLIRPAIKGAKTEEDAIKANVRFVVANLKKTPLLKELISKKKIECVSAYYNFDTGRVEILK